MAKIVKTLKFPNDSDDYQVNAVALDGKEANKYALLDSPALTGTPTAPTADVGTSTTQIATTAFVRAEVDNKLAANDAMIYKGTIGSGGTVNALPSTHNAGWTYKVVSAGTYAGYSCEIGDMLICTTDGTSANNAHWSVVQSNIDGAVTGPASSTNGVFPLFSGTTGKVIKNSSYGPTSFASSSHNHDSDYVKPEADKYHTNGSWSGLKYTATAQGGAAELSFTVPTGEDSNTVARGDHTHKYAGSKSKGGPATSAETLTTTDAGTYKQPVYFSEGKPNRCTALDEGLLNWTETINKSGALGPIDVAMSSLHSANRLAFSKPEGITIEYSTDGGQTFNIYPRIVNDQVDHTQTVLDSHKVDFVSGISRNFTIGAKTRNETPTVNDLLRITLNPSNMQVYTRAMKLLINVSTEGATGCYVSVQTSKKGAPSTFSEPITYPISGWSGWNSIPLNAAFFGGNPSQTSNVENLRLTFGITGLTTAGTNLLGIKDIAIHGDTCWTSPTGTNLARTGHVYSYDSAQNVVFPASVTASNFNGYLVGNISGNARTATNATKDSADNVIVDTYATKAQLTNYAPLKHNHSTDDLEGGIQTWYFNCGTSTTVLD